MEGENPAQDGRPDSDSDKNGGIAGNGKNKIKWRPAFRGEKKEEGDAISNQTWRSETLFERFEL